MIVTIYTPCAITTRIIPTIIGERSQSQVINIDISRSVSFDSRNFSSRHIMGERVGMEASVHLRGLAIVFIRDMDYGVVLAVVWFSKSVGADVRGMLKGRVQASASRSTWFWHAGIAKSIL